MMERTTVLIPTYRRPDLLARLLDGLSRQTMLTKGWGGRVIVMDNDVNESARAIAESSRPIDVGYHVATEPGIAATRNALLEAVDEATEWAAFIDDDEVPEDDWLERLHETAVRTSADAVAGPVVSRFASPPPGWVVAGGFFERTRHRTGTILRHAFTGNVLIRMNAVRRLELRFDERLNLVGGEDRNFFQRFVRGGGVIVWCDEAVAYETVLDERVDEEWIVRRMLRVGTSTAFIERDLSPGTWTSCVLLAKAFVWILLGLVARGRAEIGSDRARLVEARRKLAYGRGLWRGLRGQLVAEYARGADD